MKVVLDTNVLVSGLLNPFGAPAQIVRMVSSGSLVLCYDARILLEYREVLLRPLFSFNTNHVDDLLDYIKSNGEAVSANALASRLPDSHDEVFLEVALAGAAQYLVTGNLKHYPVDKRQGVKVVSPRDFLDLHSQQK